MKVDAMVAAAEAEARQIIEKANADVAASLRDAEAKLRRLEVERESVGQYVDNLKLVFERLQSNLKVD
jgi:hypothetical protein